MKEELNIYGFGSYFNGLINYQDIDVLIIHQSIEYKSCKLAIKCKKLLSEELNNIDATILSTSEESQLSFIKKSNAYFIGKIRSTSLENDIYLILNAIKNKNITSIYGLHSQPFPANIQ